MPVEKLTPAEAVEFAKKEHGITIFVSTIRTWCKPPPIGHSIGLKIGGRLYVIKKRLIWILEGTAWKSIKEGEKNK